MAASTSPKTLREAILHYADPMVCQDALVAARWPNGVTCPTCGRTDVAFLKNQNRWQCKGKHSRRQFSAKVGTIFEDSPIDLSKWFVAIWLIASAKNGISSYELHRAIGITQKSAWFVLHRIRLAMQAGNFEKKFDGHVEVDETFIGGQARYMHKDKRDKAMRGMVSGRWHRTAVVGAIQRGTNGQPSQAVARVIENTRRKTVMPFVHEHVSKEKTVLYTDALKSYEQPPTWTGERHPDAFEHKVIDHAVSYVQGDIHTNGAENFWALTKRMLKGTYVSVEPFHLHRYLDEEVYRFNSRKMTDGARFDAMMTRLAGKRLTYARLIGERSEQSA
jgi:transposase-like protein